MKMGKNLFRKTFRLIPLLFILNCLNLSAHSSSALAAWSLGPNGVLELRTKTNSKLKAFFQKANNSFGDRFWIDFQGELKTPRKIKGNGPVKEIRLGKPSKGVTRFVIEFNQNTNLKPLNWKLIGKNENTWKIKIASFPKNTFQKLSEGSVEKLKINSTKPKKFIQTNIPQSNFSNLPSVKQNKFYVVIDPGHGGPDSGAIGIDGLRETDVVLDVSKTVASLLRGKGVNVRMTRINEVDLDLSPRVSLANRTGADIFVSIHANASRGKKKNINGLETFYYDGWKGRLLAEKIQRQILKVSPGSPDRGVRRGRYYVIKRTNMPAVLVEIGFVTGRLDARRLEKISHRKRVAYAIAKGILEYLKRVS